MRGVCRVGASSRADASDPGHQPRSVERARAKPCGACRRWRSQRSRRRSARTRCSPSTRSGCSPIAPLRSRPSSSHRRTSWRWRTSAAGWTGCRSPSSSPRRASKLLSVGQIRERLRRPVPAARRRRRGQWSRGSGRCEATVDWSYELLSRGRTASARTAVGVLGWMDARSGRAGLRRSRHRRRATSLTCCPGCGQVARHRR